MRAPSVPHLEIGEENVKSHRMRWAPVMALLTLGCAATQEGAVRQDLRTAGLELRPADSPAPPPESLDGTLGAYLRFASAGSPALRESYERWRAAVHRISPARRMPDPMVTYAFYALPVQTRVGPQRHRLGIRQTIPWPTRLSAAADARSLGARAAQRGFEARILAIQARVAVAWWRLWAIRRMRGVHRDQLTLAGTVVETARVRMEIGRSTLADVAQLELVQARLEDELAGIDERERAAEALLRAAIGADAATEVPTVMETPDALLPPEPLHELAEAARAHPRLEAYELRAQSHEAQAASAEASRFPSVVLGLDWIETGEAVMMTNGSGADALLLSVGVSIPIFAQEAGAELQRAEEAEGAAERAGREDAEDRAVAELTEAWSALRDAHRRLGLYAGTLAPQARAAYESVIGGYATGDIAVAATLAAQRAFLEIELAQIRARAEHGVAWARVEALVGRPLGGER